jgi:uncharacterized protein (DUF58 family)
LSKANASAAEHLVAYLLANDVTVGAGLYDTDVMLCLAARDSRRQPTRCLEAQRTYGTDTGERQQWFAYPELLYNWDEAILYEALRLQYLQQQSSFHAAARDWIGVLLATSGDPRLLSDIMQQAADSPPSVQAACLPMQNAALAAQCAESGTCPLQVRKEGLLCCCTNATGHLSM